MWVLECLSTSFGPVTAETNTARGLTKIRRGLIEIRRGFTTIRRDFTKVRRGFTKIRPARTAIYLGSPFAVCREFTLKKSLLDGRGDNNDNN